MQTSRDRWNLAAWLMLAGVTAWNVVRAATQSLTVDEAATWNQYLQGDLRQLLTDFDARNHVLYTFLARISVAVFGGSELAIRLPSLAGGILYFTATFRLCRRIAGSGWLFLLGLAAMSLNPFVLDFLSAARGYGLACGFLLWGLESMMREEPRPALAGAMMGLAIASNLSFAFPALSAGFLYCCWRRTEALRFLVTAAVSAFIVLGIPVSYAKPGTFYVGSESLFLSLMSLTTASSRHHMTALGDPQIALVAAAPYMVFATVAIALFAGPWLPRAAFALTAAGIVAAHLLAGVLYPEFRTGLYLIPLGTLVIVGAAARYRLLAIPLGLAVAVYAIQFPARTYMEWDFDSSTKDIAQRLQSSGLRRPGENRAAVTWELEPSMNYYRARLGLNWLKPLDRSPADGEFDYYILLPRDAGIVQKRGLTVIYTAPETGVVLAAPR